ncbi:MAG: hypothetical protein WHS88_10230 [Anaerohalosphaeraceae bacterium]
MFKENVCGRRRRQIVGCLVLLWLGGARGALRIVSYNTCGAVRSGMGTILEAVGNDERNGIVRPVDILLVQEQVSVSTTTQQLVNLLNGIYGAGVYARGTLDGATTGAGRPGVVYNTQTVVLLEEVPVNVPSSDGAARATIRYKFRPVGYSRSEAEFYVYNSHFKAESDSENQNRRATEAGEIRANSDALGEGVHLLYAGDLNLYTASEPAWSVLTAAGPGQAFDPAGMVGNWHDNPAFILVHSQSPVTTERYGGQVTGGMDDRFDFQLVSNEMLDGEGLSFLSGSYRVFGNNGTHQLNGEITSGSGAAPAVLTALAETSDHLPVVADYQIPAKMTVSVGAIPAEVLYNQPVQIPVTIANTAPVSVPLGADELDYVLTAGGAVSGTAAGSVLAGGEEVRWVTLTAASVGPQSGQIVVSTSSQGAENPLFVQEVVYTVVPGYTVQMIEYGWEDFTSRYDPSAVLGSSGTAVYGAVQNEPNEGLRCLEISNGGDCESAVYLAAVSGLLAGDTVQVSCQGRHFAAEDGGIRLGAYRLADTGDAGSIVGPTGADSNLSGTAWGTLEGVWTFEGQAGEGILIAAKLCGLSGGGALDALRITVPSHAQVRLPRPTEVVCGQTGPTDLNGDCRVNLADLALFARGWLDGETLEGGLSASEPAVVITGILDGTLSGNTPKAMELYVRGTADLSGYVVQQSIDGGAWNNGFSLSGIFTDTYVYVIRSNNSGVSYFDSIFGSEGAFGNRIAVSDVLYCDNGNDGFRLIKDGVVVDQVYERNSAQVYRDSFLYRRSGTGPDGGWLSSNWIFGGNDLLDFKTPAQIAGLVPFGTYRMDTSCTVFSELDWVQDCRIDLADLKIFAEQWMQCTLQPEWACWD